MSIIITGKNIDLTDAIKSYIEEKMRKLDQYLKDVEPVEVSVWIQVNKGKGEDWSKVEATLTIPNLTIRSEELAQDLYGAVDIVQEKLERKIRENKEKIIEQKREATGEINPKDLEKIVKRKNFDLGNPVDESDAITRMELLGHDFYIYKDIKTNKQSVVYRRKDGGYGVISGK
ncbi:MAG TPA: ribosome-associated translation inhibitor RaiA [Patescibacteria group bacterium]|nr:ribosome-associated translation inhibitor RaiA [Patescibacteria group bacterium]